ncbi:unnamed protein product, partial [Laminaria digitata]
KRYVLVVEHDLAVLDYLSDFICCLYGTPSAYGVVTMPFSVREGINVFLAGFVPTENLRFRDATLDSKVRSCRRFFSREDGEVLANGNTNLIYTYPNMTKTMRSKTGKQFKLHVEEGQFADSEILVLLGELNQ